MKRSREKEKRMQIVKSRRKTIAIQVKADGAVIVRCPLGMRSGDIAEFVEKHSGWIDEKREEMKKLTAERRKISLSVGETIPFMGKELSVEESENSPGLMCDENTVYIRPGMDEAQRACLLENFYRSMAQKILPDRTRALADDLGFKVSEVKISGAKKRWGSCSSRGSINLSWRLMAADSDAVDYVIVHELCHLVHHDHSGEFWGLVKKILPDYKEREKRLDILSGSVDWRTRDEDQ